MFIETDKKQDIIEFTKKYCGAVAISCHQHLKDYWTKAAIELTENKIKVNFHIIISDKKSIDSFVEIYENWKEKIDYFVLLPQMNSGRSKDAVIEWDYLISNLPENKSKIAFGANFYPYLIEKEHNIDIDLYEPEIMSKYLDLSDMRVYGSSFHL